jgi:hypothetical protein
MGNKTARFRQIRELKATVAGLEEAGVCVCVCVRARARLYVCE